MDSQQPQQKSPEIIATRTHRARARQASEELEYMPSQTSSASPSSEPQPPYQRASVLPLSNKDMSHTNYSIADINIANSPESMAESTLQQRVFEIFSKIQHVSDSTTNAQIDAIFDFVPASERILCAQVLQKLVKDSPGMELKEVVEKFLKTPGLEKYQNSAGEFAPQLPAPYQRVRSPYDVVIVESNIEGAGRGLFVKDHVAAHELVVDESENLSKTCDYCLDTLEVMSDGTRLQTSLKDLEHLCCTGCDTLYYCYDKNDRKLCQSRAWREYHRYECKMFAMIRNYEKKSQATISMLGDADVRSVIRLVCLYYEHKINDDDWEILMGLHMAADRAKGFDSHKDMISRHVFNIAKELDLSSGPDHDLSKKDLQDLYMKLQQNHLDLSVPFLKTVADPTTYMMATRGICIDTFASMMNHACEPNVLWQHDGRQLRVIALRDIAAGEELCTSVTEDMLGESTLPGAYEESGMCLARGCPRNFRRVYDRFYGTESHLAMLERLS
ncbi:hypothetical protein BJ878DRAFT_579253 [Calycina marina]|uniref:SET domain-containing protein n=1 Tax=Calycina marina TaxID=1763456 RepID=A0A9P7YVU6_9HELO|nr:hypothetical protein BJ878DRAFT_579253 [Calycina marina]